MNQFPEITLNVPDNYSIEYLSKLILSGVQCFRINCALGDNKEWTKKIDVIRLAEESANKPCKILMDLGGAKIRIEGIKEKIAVRKNDNIFVCKNTIDTENVQDIMRSGLVQHSFYLSSQEVFGHLSIGQKIFIDDGRIGAVVEAIESEYIILKVVYTVKAVVKLGNQKGMNIPDLKYNFRGMTNKDKNDLQFACEFADIISFSFAQSAEDVSDFLTTVNGLKNNIQKIVKIESKKAYENIDEILNTIYNQADISIMVARGDLAIEVGYERLPLIQEDLFRRAEQKNLYVITATQVLESLMQKNKFSRAEISDAFNLLNHGGILLNKGKYCIETLKFISQLRTH